MVWCLHACNFKSASNITRHPGCMTGRQSVTLKYANWLFPIASQAGQCGSALSQERDFSVAPDLRFLAGVGKQVVPAVPRSHCQPCSSSCGWALSTGSSSCPSQRCSLNPTAHLNKYQPQPSWLSGTAASSSASVHAPTRSCTAASDWCSFLLRAFLSSPQHPATNQMFLHFSLPRFCLLQHGALCLPP